MINGLIKHTIKINNKYKYYKKNYGMFTESIKPKGNLIHVYWKFESTKKKSTEENCSANVVWLIRKFFSLLTIFLYLIININHLFKINDSLSQNQYTVVYIPNKN